MSKKNKKHNSSIRKKIVHGYMGIYTFISVMLFLIVLVAAYFVSFYVIDGYSRFDIETALDKIVEYKQAGLDDEALYEQAERLMPDFVERYDLIKETRKIKEEEYYDNSYYEATVKVNTIEEVESINLVTPTPMSEVEENQVGEDNYNEEDLKKGYVTSSILYIRIRPDIEASIYDSVGYATELYVIEDLGEWYRVIYHDKELYVASRFISFGAVPTPTPEYYEEFWEAETEHLFSKSGTEYTTLGRYDYDQLENPVLSLKEPYLIYSTTRAAIFIESDNLGYVTQEYYIVRTVVDVTDFIPIDTQLSVVAIFVVFSLILYFAGLLLMWIYGATRTRKYLRAIDEITRLTNEIQPNSNYRLNVNTAKFELKELVITVNNMLDRLNDAHVKRKKFVSDVSHELRTPISVVAGYANMLKRWAKDDEAVFDESVDAIMEEASNMKYLVENLLFLARSDNDQNVYEMENFDISSLIQTICKDAKMVDKDKHEVSCAIEQGVIINGDRNRIKQALREFMLNALKYTPPMGDIKISLQKNEGKAIISIKDTGMGISKKDMAHIFTRFYRGDVSRNRANGGYGLGLSICREIISAHKGKISFKSKEDAGTEVTVILDHA